MKHLKSLLLAVVPALLLGLLAGCGKSAADVPTTGAITAPEYSLELSGVVARLPDGTVLLVTEESGIVELTGEMNFTGLQNGDRLTTYCGGLTRSYPGQADVLDMTLHSHGSLEELTEAQLTELQKLGFAPEG